MKLTIKRGKTGLVLSLYIQDTRFGDGRGLAGVAYNSPGIVAWYKRLSDSAPITIPLVAGTIGSWVSGGFAELTAAPSIGFYEFGVPDAAFAAGESVIIVLTGAANMAPILCENQLVAYDPQDGAGLGLTGVNLNLAQAVPVTNTAQTVGDSLNAARADGFGKWIQSGTTLTLYAADGSTIVRTFTLDDATNPHQRV